MTGMARVASSMSLTARLLRMFMPAIVAQPTRPLVLGDVVDGAGGRADTRTDERALAGPVAGSGADRGARARADRRAAQGPARRRDERNQGQPDHGGEDSRLRRLLGHGAPPA